MLTFQYIRNDDLQVHDEIVLGTEQPPSSSGAVKSRSLIILTVFIHLVACLLLTE